jgi:hypothetical protein
VLRALPPRLSAWGNPAGALRPCRCLLLPLIWPPHCRGPARGLSGGTRRIATGPPGGTLEGCLLGGPLQSTRGVLMRSTIDGGFSACVVQVPMLRYICKSSPTHPLGSSGGVSLVAGLRFPGRNYYVHDHHASSGCVCQQLYSHAIFGNVPVLVGTWPWGSNCQGSGPPSLVRAEPLTLVCRPAAHACRSPRAPGERVRPSGQLS